MGLYCGFSQSVLLLILTLKVVTASRPFVIQAPSKHAAAADESSEERTLTIDQAISRVMRSHSNKPWLESPSTTSLLMSGDSSMVLAEMDMMLTSSQYANLYSKDEEDPETRSHSRQKRKVYRSANAWRNKEVPYILNPWDFSANERAIIHLAMQEWEQYTCMKFRPSNSSDVDKLVFQDGIGCNSQLGRVGGIQPLNLEAPGCRFKGLYLHEIGHALGLVHEHQLPTRDNHIDIVWSNVKPEWKQWFNKYSSTEISADDNVPYDLTSVMHYGINAFSYDEKSQTIKARDKSLEDSIGRVYKKELSFNDIKAVNTLYQCNAHCDGNIRCSAGGYVGKDCMCVCPSGGNSCQTSPRAPPIPTTNCENEHSDNSECAKWTDEGQCSLNPIWMIKNCRRSCNKCDRVHEVTLPAKYCANRFDDDDCDTYAMAGECSANPAWMYYNCKASCAWCTPPTTCKDLFPDSLQCREWKRLGNCDRNPAWMWANCRQTCRICTNPPEGCENKAGDDKCYADASVGECKENSDYMNENCAKACGKCGSCYNTYPDDSVCIDLASAGECTSSPEWMGRYCTKACDACDGKELPIGEARPCADKDKRCEKWSQQGECSANPSWMIPNCQKSCGRCACVNKHNNAQCDVWEADKQCESNKPWMSENCQKSCRFCTNLPPPPDRCSNKYSGNAAKCDQWQSEGECFKNPLFMIPQCRKSCTQCDSSKGQCNDWSLWSAWTGCSRTCGTGMKSRTRRCLKGDSGTQDEMLGCMMSECVTTESPISTSSSGFSTKSPIERTTPMPTVTEVGPILPPSCENKHTRHSDCETWAKYGHCESNPSWMHTNCAMSCNLCIRLETCSNKYGDDEQCEEWEDGNQCVDNPSWMLSNCAKACRQCETSPAVTTTESPTSWCINLHHSEMQCQSWGKSGHCDINPGFMHVNCAKTCDTCGDKTETSSRPTTPITPPPPNPTPSTVSIATPSTIPTTAPITAVPPPPDCEDKHSSCAAWADSSTDYCAVSEYVKDNCKTSCSLCTTPLQKELGGIFLKGECYDRLSDCKRRALEGRCNSHSKQMQRDCPYSCEYCQPGLCINVDSNCDRWAQTQACHIFPKLMAKKCKLACGYCSTQNTPVKVAQP